jgi:hypothetical protein
VGFATRKLEQGFANRRNTGERGPVKYADDPLFAELKPGAARMLISREPSLRPCVMCREPCDFSTIFLDHIYMVCSEECYTRFTDTIYAGLRALASSDRRGTHERGEGKADGAREAQDR